MIRFYGYKKCGTCRKAEKFLGSAGIRYEFIDITEHPPTAATIKGVARQADVPLKKLFNTSGVQYRELRIKERLPALTDKQVVDLLASNGRLIRRPLISDGKRATVGFDEAVFTRVWT